jgi:hypothetical protein
MMPLETRVTLAKAIASRASALGLGPVEYELRDAYSRKTCREGQLDQLLSEYRPGDNVMLEVLARFGRSRVKVTA